MKSSPNARRLFDLEGRVFLLTGGARSLGRDMATALAEAGACGVVTSRTSSAAEIAAEEISAATGRRVEGLCLDATDENSVKGAVDQAFELFGRIDVLVNNAGGGSISGAWDLEGRSREAWDTLQAVNVTAPFLLSKRVTPIMRSQGSGSVINIASIAGLIGRDRQVYPAGMTPQTVDYATAKGAVIAMTRDLAACLGSHGIRVNAISPGGFERGQPREFIERYSAKVPLGRMGRDGSDLKGAIVFLASDASAYVTGHNLVVDGGFSIWR